MIKRYKSFLESNREDVGQGLLEYFLDLEDEFGVDVEVDTILLDHWSIRILTLEGFGVGDLKDLLISISGIIKRMKSIGDFTPSSVHKVGTDTVKRAKWGSIEGWGRIWYRFGDLDIIEPVAMFGSMMSREEFRVYYRQEIRGMSIWMDFLARE